MQATNCVLCESSDSIVLFDGYDRLYGGPGSFPMQRCLSCGALYISPRPEPEELARYYPDDYAPHAMGGQPSSWQRWNAGYAASKLVRAVLARVPGPGHALDVGCATGEFLIALQRRGWQVQGVEISERAAAHAQAKVQGTIFVGDFMDAAYPDNAFDLVTYWDVLEHLPDPRVALAEAARITRPSGYLALSIPNLDSLEARIFGTDWAGWDIPRHMWLAPRSVLVRVLEETGWIVEEVTCLRGRQHMLALSVRIWLADGHLPARLRTTALKVVRSLPAKLLLWPYFAVVEKLARGSILALFARRGKGFSE